MNKASNSGISVCIATYNGEKYIAEQLSSIVTQLPHNSEIIISDDNSTDDTLRIIEDFGDSRITVIKNNAKAGVVTNFQNAINFSSRQTIYLADQDDIWDPEKIEMTLPSLQSNLLICHDCSLINKNGELLKPSLFKTNDAKPGIVKNLARNSYTGCCMAFRRELLDYALPFPKKIYMHDIWLGLIAECYGKVSFIDGKLVQFRRHDTTLTSTGAISTNSFSRRIQMRLALMSCLLGRIAMIAIKRQTRAGI